MMKRGAYIVVLVSLLGFGPPWKTVAVAPSGPPQDVTAVPTSSTTVQVTWNDVLVAERNGALTEYEVQYEQFTFSQISQSIRVRIAAEQEDVVTLHGLQEYVEYTVSVRALNEDGAGPFSTAVTATTYQDAPISTPQDFSLTVSIPNQLFLSWDRPPEIDINGVLTFYSLRYHKVGSADFFLERVNGSLQSSVIEGLDNYTMYEVLIAAMTVNGTGPFISQAARTSENVPQSPPQNITANSTSPYSISMEWRPPDQSEWNGILRGYRLRYAKTDSALPLNSIDEWCQIHLPNHTSYCLQHLQSSTLYCIQVAAVTVGTGPFSPPLYIATLEDNETIVSGSSSGEYSGMSSSGSGDTELMGSPTTHTNTNDTVTTNVNDTMSTQHDSSVAIIAGSVVAVALVLGTVAALVPIVAVAVWRRQRVRKSKSFSHYLAATNPHEGFSEQSVGLTFANSAAGTTPSFELQSYNLGTLPATHMQDYSSSGRSGDQRSSSVKIADNPQYWKFLSQPSHGGVVSVGLSESDYDYPATFQRSVVVSSDSDPYSEVRTTSNQDPPYATVQ